MKNTNLKKCFTASLLGIIALGGYAQVNYVEPPIRGYLHISLKYIALC